MSNTVLTALTFIEVVVLVAVLALFLHLLAVRLRSVAAKLEAVNRNVAVIGEDVGILNVGAPLINTRLRNVVEGLGGIAAKAEALLRR